MAKESYKRIIARYGTFAQWEQSNPILANGEIAGESDSGLEKLGNGVDDWKNLPYTSHARQTWTAGKRYFDGDTFKYKDTLFIVKKKTSFISTLDIEPGAAKQAGFDDPADYYAAFYADMLANRANIVSLSGTRTYYPDYPTAEAAAKPGDTIIVPNNIIDLTKVGNAAYISIGANISLHTYGFQIGREDGVADAISLYPWVSPSWDANLGPSYGKIMGMNSSIVTNTNAATWGLGAYGFSSGHWMCKNQYYDIYDLNFKSRGRLNDTIAMFQWDSITNFFNCHVDAGTTDGHGVRIMNGVGNFYDCTFIGSSNNVLAWANSGPGGNGVINFYNCKFILKDTSSLYVDANCSINFYDCSIDARASTRTDYLIGDASKSGNILLENTSIVGNNVATVISCNTLQYEGNSVIKGNAVATTVIDNRPIKPNVPIAMTHAALRALKTAGFLVQGSLYQITDFATSHKINGSTPTAINTGPIEQIILTASSVNTFFPNVVSTTWPLDEIKYDIDNILCEDGTTARKGWIYYRRDTVLNNTVEGWDFRVVRWRRYEYDAPVYDPGIDYPLFSVVRASVGGPFWFLFNTGTGPTLKGVAPVSGNNWYYLFYGVGKIWGFSTPINHDGSTAPYKITTIPGSTSDFLTFSGWNNGSGGSGGNNYQGGDYAHFKGKNNNIKGGSITSDIVIAAGRPGGDYPNDYSQGIEIEGNTFEPACNNIHWWGWSHQFNVIERSVSKVHNYGTFSKNFLDINSSSIQANDAFAFNRVGKHSFNIVPAFNHQKITYGFQAANIACARVCVNCNFGGGCWFVTVGENGQEINFLQLYNWTIANDHYRDIQIGANCKRLFFNEDCKTVFIAPGSFGLYTRVFNNVGTQALPVLFTNCDFQRKVDGLTVPNAGVTLTNVISQVVISNKIIPASLVDKNITLTSPDGRIWTPTIDNAGTVTNTPIV